MNGHQRNQARAQTVDENISIFFRSADTKSAVQTVNTHIPTDVAAFIAKAGAISNATQCDSVTAIVNQMSYFYRIFKEKLLTYILVE